MLRNGAKIENVSRMLGHTNITQTQKYAKVLARSVQDEFDRMVSMFPLPGGDNEQTCHPVHNDA